METRPIIVSLDNRTPFLVALEISSLPAPVTLETSPTLPGYSRNHPTLPNYSRDQPYSPLICLPVNLLPRKHLCIVLENGDQICPIPLLRRPVLFSGVTLDTRYNLHLHLLYLNIPLTWKGGQFSPSTQYQLHSPVTSKLRSISLTDLSGLPFQSSFVT